MTLGKYIFLMILATIACYLAFFSVLYFFDPFTGGILVLLFFYTSLLLALIGTFSILGLIVRLIFTRDRLVFKKVINAFRQSLWFSLLIIISLILFSLNLFAWVNLILLIVAFGLLELFFISYKSKSSQRI